MTNAQNSHGNAHGKFPPQAPIENPNRGSVIQPSGCPAKPCEAGANLGYAPQNNTAVCEAARQREADLRQKAYSYLGVLVVNTVEQTKTK